VVIHLFERIYFFLQRLNIYIGIPLTNDLTALLGNVMAHLLFILALSTKVMTDGRMSELVDLLCPFRADFATEKVLKRLVGKKDVEDALERFDMLTKEEISMTVARNLKVAHDVDGNVTEIKATVQNMDGNVTVIKDVIGDVDSNVKQTEALTKVIDANVKTSIALTEGVGNDVKVIDHNVRAAKHGTRLFSVHFHALTERYCVKNQQRTSLNVRYFLTLESLTPMTDKPSQGTSCKRNFEHGSLLQILLSIIMSHIKLSTAGLGHGLSKAIRSENGRRAVLYYGSVGIVCVPPVSTFLILIRSRILQPVLGKVSSRTSQFSSSVIRSSYC